MLAVRRFMDDGKAPALGPFIWSSGLVVIALDDSDRWADTFGVLDGYDVSPRYYFDIVNVQPDIPIASVQAFGEEVSATLITRDISPGDIESILVDYGDGTPPSQLLAERNETEEAPGWFETQFHDIHTFTAAGTYTVTFTVTDDDPTNPRVVTRQVTTEGPGPVIELVGQADINGPEVVSVVYVTISDLDDALEGEVSLLVDWGDGDRTEYPFDPVAAKFIGRHTYRAEGRFDVIVSARDAQGNYPDDAGEYTAAVVNDPPTLTLDSSVPSSVPEGSEFVLSGSVVSPDGAIVDVDWGDGTDSEGTQPEVGGAFDLGHTYPADDGQYTVTVTATDGPGKQTEVTHGVTVTNVAPTITKVTAVASVVPFEPFTVAVAFTDPGTDTHVASVDWGDGTSTGSLPGVSAQHSYATAGTYTVKVTVVDDDGGSVTHDVALLVKTPLAAVTDVVAALRTKQQTAPAPARPRIATALTELDGPPKTDAVDSLAAGALKPAASRLRNAVEALVLARTAGADVNPEIASLVAINRSLAVGCIAGASARGVSSKTISKARTALATGDTATAQGRPAAAAESYYEAVKTVCP